MFVYGGRGYGTLQEYLVLDKYIDEIKPDLIILQVSGNDFINNSWELEAASYTHNNMMVRPYLIDGRIEYRFPRSLWKQRMFLTDHSRLLYLLITRLDKLYARGYRGELRDVAEVIERKGMDFADFRTASTITNKIVGKIRSRAGNIPIVAFSVVDYPVYQNQFRKIFRENNIVFIEDVPVYIRNEEKKELI